MLALFFFFFFFFIFCSLESLSLSVSLFCAKGSAHTRKKARKMDDDDDDPFDFKLGVDALRAKTESKLATALENARVVDDADADDAPNNGNVVELSSNHHRDFSSAQKKKTNGEKASAKSNADDDRNEKRKETNDDAAQATIESFSTETKVILTTLGKMLERLEALELVALRNAKEVARMEHALQGFIVSQTRKENGKEPITSANLFTVADSEEEANVENTNGFVNESEEVDEAVVVRTLVRQADEFHLS